MIVQHQSFQVLLQKKMKMHPNQKALLVLLLFWDQNLVEHPWDVVVGEEPQWVVQQNQKQLLLQAHLNVHLRTNKWELHKDHHKGSLVALRQHQPGHHHQEEEEEVTIQEEEEVTIQEEEISHHPL